MFGGVSTLPPFQQEQGGSYSHNSHIMSLRCCCWRQLTLTWHLPFSPCTLAHTYALSQSANKKVQQRWKSCETALYFEKKSWRTLCRPMGRDPSMDLSQKQTKTHSSNVHTCSSCLARTLLSLRYAIIFKTKLKPVLQSNKKKETLTNHHQRKLKSFFHWLAMHLIRQVGKSNVPRGLRVGKLPLL